MVTFIGLIKFMGLIYICYFCFLFARLIKFRFTCHKNKRFFEGEKFERENFSLLFRHTLILSTFILILLLF